jgi:hypothetical protein
VVSRIYNASTSGVDEFMTYAGNIYDTKAKMDLFLKYLSLIRKGIPERDGALLYPDMDLVLGRAEFFRDFSPTASMVRDYSDIVLADDRLIEDGILNNVRWMFVLNTHFCRKASLEKIVAWVNGGGLLVGAGTDSLCAIEDGRNFFPAVFDPKGGEKRVGKGATLFVAAPLAPLHSVQPAGQFSPDEKPGPGVSEEYQLLLLDPATAFLTKHGILIPDGKIDRVYTAVIGGRMLVLNHTRHRIVRTFFESTGKTRTITLEGNSITEITR